MLSHFSCIQLFATLKTVAHWAPLSMGFSRQEYYSGLPFPTPGAPHDPGVEPTCLVSHALAGKFFTTTITYEALWHVIYHQHTNITDLVLLSTWRLEKTKALGLHNGFTRILDIQFSSLWHQSLSLKNLIKCLKKQNSDMNFFVIPFIRGNFSWVPI